LGSKKEIINNESSLKKDLGLIPASALVIGMVIGSGVFFKPHAVFTATGAPGLGLIAWVLGGIISIAGGLTVAELAVAMPRTGGMIVYLEEAYGKVWGFLLGWAQTIIFYPATIAAEAIIFSTQVINLTGLSGGMLNIIAIITAIFLLGMNCLGVKTGGYIQTVATVCKLIPIIAIIIIGLVTGGSGAVNLLPMTVANHPVITGLGSALVATMFAYDGWISVATIAGEMKNPAKDLPKAIIAGLSLVMAVYILINIVYLFVLPASTLASSATPAGDVAKILFGRNGGTIITIGILVSIFGCLNGNILTAMRIPYKLATEGTLPGSAWLSKLHSTFKTPINAGIVEIIIAIVFIFSGKFDQLTNLTVFVIFMFYVLTFYAVFILRKRQPDLYRPYKVPMYPVIPAIAIIGGIYIIGNTIITEPMNAGLGLVLTLIGLPVYKMMNKNN
jgi:APA family basic amino acid/polyamine antiporter